MLLIIIRGAQALLKYVEEGRNIMDSLFDEVVTFEPLAVRMRPKSLDEFYGQNDVVGRDGFLRSMIENDMVPSLLLYGPSGSGKTTLARIIAGLTKSKFISLNATSTGVPELRAVLERAKKDLLAFQQRTILFLDEIHRFNKAQQDVLLPAAEDGSIVLIGATTENPFFEINRALLSRLRLIRLKPLSENAVVSILRRALTDEVKGLGKKSITASEEVLHAIFHVSDGDARMALNVLEQAVALLPQKGELTVAKLEKLIERRIQTYDKHGNSHYDTVSAFIKSMRGSDPQATLHYLARMIEGGEDPNFIVRRIVICAAEDVGLADPQALVVANAAAQAVHLVGFPEARIILSEAALYIALAPKSNSAYIAIDRALHDVQSKDCGAIPSHLCDAHYKGAKAFGHGVAYRYPHDYAQAYVEQEYLPASLKGISYYEATSHGLEEALHTKWEERKKGNNMV